MGKFEDAFAEAAFTLSAHGFAHREDGTVEEGGGYQALVSVSVTLLLNVGEGAVAEALREVGGECEHVVWIKAGFDGYVSTIMRVNSTKKPRRVMDLERHYDRVQRARWADAEACEEVGS